MARTNYVNKARKAQGDCNYCGKPIEAGTSYKWVAIKTSPRSSRRMARHADCPAWKASELTTSSQKSAMLSACESAYDAIGAWSAEDGIDALEEIVQQAAEGFREAAEMYRESAQNIEDGFGHATYLSDELNEKADQCDSTADDLESWSPSTSPEDDEERYILYIAGEEHGRYATEAEAKDACDEHFAKAGSSADESDLWEIAENDEEPEWVESARSEAEDAIADAEGNMP